MARKAAFIRVPLGLQRATLAFTDAVGAVAPDLLRALTMAYWEKEDTLQFQKAISESSVVVVNGSDETVQAVATLCTDVPMVAHGSRRSIAVANSEELLQPTWGEFCRGLALDVVLWAQRGCASPTVLFVVGRGALSMVACAELDAAIETQRIAFGRGDLRPQEQILWAETKMQNWVRGGSHFHTFKNVSVASINGTELPVLSGGFLVVVSIPDWKSLHSVSFDPPLSTIVSEGADPIELKKLAQHSGASRLVAPGEAQSPKVGWHHDGYAVLRPLLD